MRKNLVLAVLAALLLGAAAPKAVRADEDDGAIKLTKDLSLTVGYKLWLATWETAYIDTPTSEFGTHVVSAIKGPVGASIPNLSLKYKKVLLAASYMTSNYFTFPDYADTCATCFNNGPGISTYSGNSASRTEADLNLGYYFTPNIAMTVGYKNVTQKYLTDGVSGASYTKYNGWTIGVAGAASIGHGFALYGNGVGGLMSVSYDPKTPVHDSATYESTEVGIAWKGTSVPIGVSLGYKFQYLITHLKAANWTGFGGRNAADVTRGYILGINYTF